jgi:hypothetical protein
MSAHAGETVGVWRTVLANGEHRCSELKLAATRRQKEGG